MPELVKIAIVKEVQIFDHDKSLMLLIDSLNLIFGGPYLFHISRYGSGGFF